MSDITINYKGNAIATMDASGTKTLLTEGKYCEDDITLTYTKPGGGGATVLSGSFVAGTGYTLNITVSRLCSHLYIYKPDLTADTDLSQAPYGASKRLTVFVDNDNGFVTQTITNSSGTGTLVYFERLGQWGDQTGTNNVYTFDQNSITASSMRVNGASRQFVDGATYNWVAW